MVTLIILLVVVLLAVLLAKPKVPKQAAPDANPPAVIDGRRIRRVYGLVWIEEGVPLAWRPMGVVPIKLGGKK